MTEKKTEVKKSGAKAEVPDSKIKALEARAKKAEAESKKLKAKLAEMEAKNAELKARRESDAATIAALTRKAAKVESLEKLLARDGPHDPVSKYD